MNYKKNDYIQIDKGEEMDVQFSADGNEVKIDLLKGYKEYDEGNLIKYRLKEAHLQEDDSLCSLRKKNRSRTYYIWVWRANNPQLTRLFDSKGMIIIYLDKSL